MAVRYWERNELILAMNLYCQLPFGKLHKNNSDVVALANAINRTPSSVAMKLCNLASLDPVHRQRGVKGLAGASKCDRAVWKEFHDDWGKLSGESEALREKMLPETDSESVGPEKLHVYAGETDEVASVRVRRAQRFFRRSVLASYDSKCCISGIDLTQLLIASHILPWSKHPEHRANPRNGFCLSRLHDAAFDQGLITFDEEFRLVLSSSLIEATTNETMKVSFLAFEGKSITLPGRFSPTEEFVKMHRETIFVDA